jgi:hypothetical protein
LTPSLASTSVARVVLDIVLSLRRHVLPEFDDSNFEGQPSRLPAQHVEAPSAAVSAIMGIRCTPDGATDRVAASVAPEDAPHEPNSETRETRPRLTIGCPCHGAPGLVGATLDIGRSVEPQQRRTLHLPGTARTLRSDLADGSQFASERTA